MAKLLIDLRCGDSLSLERGGIEDHSNGAVDSAGAGNRGDARDGKEPPGDSVVDVPAQLLQAHVGGLRADVKDWVAGNVDAGHLRLENALGQVTADLRDRVAHVVDRGVGRGADLELDEGAAAAFADRAVDFVDAVHSADRRIRSAA